MLNESFLAETFAASIFFFLNTREHMNQIGFLLVFDDALAFASWLTQMELLLQKQCIIVRAAVLGN